MTPKPPLTPNLFWTARITELGKHIEKEFPGLGFSVLLYPHGTLPGSMNYVSNSNREDVISAMREFIEKSLADEIKPFNTDFI